MRGKSGGVGAAALHPPTSPTTTCVVGHSILTIFTILLRFNTDANIFGIKSSPGFKSDCMLPASKVRARAKLNFCFLSAAFIGPLARVTDALN